MGILNVTPDSFSDGGLHHGPDAALARARIMLEEGASIIDVGGESTRPGAAPVSTSEELARVIPVIQAIAEEVPGAIISVDTYKARVAEEALKAGAHIVNDISAMTFDPDMAQIVARYDAGVVLMHTGGRPQQMQRNPHYDDVIEEVTRVLMEQADRAREAGIGREQIVVDPGIGFGKTAEHNWTILRELDAFRSLGFPILLGCSRKSFLGSVVNKPADERVFATVATTAWAVARGVRIFRVHDVAANRDVLEVMGAIVHGGPEKN